MSKWLIQREYYKPGTALHEPVLPMWWAYPPERNRTPYMFKTWRAAYDFAYARANRRSYHDLLSLDNYGL